MAKRQNYAYSNGATSNGMGRGVIGNRGLDAVYNAARNNRMSLNERINARGARQTSVTTGRIKRNTLGDFQRLQRQADKRRADMARYQQMGASGGGR